jgi:hypothetical protein
VVKHTFRAIAEKLGSIRWQVAGSFFRSLFRHYQTNIAQAVSFADNEARFAQNVFPNLKRWATRICAKVQMNAVLEDVVVISSWVFRKAVKSPRAKELTPRLKYEVGADGTMG